MLTSPESVRVGVSSYRLSVDSDSLLFAHQTVHLPLREKLREAGAVIVLLLQEALLKIDVEARIHDPTVEINELQVPLNEILPPLEPLL